MRYFRVDDCGRYRFRYWRVLAVLLPLACTGCPLAPIGCLACKGAAATKVAVGTAGAAKVAAGSKATAVAVSGGKAVGSLSAAGGAHAAAGHAGASHAASTTLLATAVDTYGAIRIVIDGIQYFSPGASEKQVIPQIGSINEKAIEMNAGSSHGIEVGTEYIVYREANGATEYVGTLFVNTVFAERCVGELVKTRLVPTIGDKARNRVKFSRDG